jgi:hypothetical protein
MKSTLIVIAVALASGLLVASGAVAGEGCCVTGPQAQQVGSRHGIDVMGPEYTDPDLRGIEELSPVDSPPAPWSDEMAPAGASGKQAETGEMAPAASRHEIDVMGPEYTDPDLRGIEELSPVDSPPAPWSDEMAPAASSSPRHGIDVMGPDYTR